VIVELDDGFKLEKVVYDSRGTPEKRLSQEEMLAKFKKITGNVFDKERLDEIVRKVMMIEEIKDISELTALLGGR